MHMDISANKTMDASTALPASFTLTGCPLRAYLAWTARQREEQVRARKTVVQQPDEGAVRVMTIHGAKGLEFPIVVLAGLNTARRPRLDPVLYDRISGWVEVKVGSRDVSLQTADYTGLSVRE